MVDFFVSHATGDRELANHLVKELESRGASCWMAPRDVPPGSDFRESIFKAVCSADAMLLLFSKNADASDHISREIFLAGEHKKTIIPLKLDDVVPSARLAYSLAGLHWIDFLENRDAALDFILAQRKSPDATRTVTASTAAPAPEPAERPTAPSTAPAQAPAPARPRRKLGVPAAVAALAIVAGIAWWVMRDGDNAGSKVDPRVAGLAAAKCTQLAGSSHELPDEFSGVAFQDLDHEQAIPACRKAVEYFPDDPGLRRQLARALLAADENDEALQILRPLALAGYTEAESNLGYVYLHGLGVEPDDQESYRWTRKAADKGEIQAQLNLAWLYLNGRGVEQNDAEAVAWYRRAADQDSGDALNSLGWMYEIGRGVAKDEAEAFKQYEAAAERGSTKAQINLGRMYQNGLGVEKDDAEAVRRYRLAADEGDASGQVNLGWMYEMGRGVDKDESEAVKWYRLAADQGNATAQLNLGVMYSMGTGIEQNDAEAVELYRAAAEQGKARAQFNLGVMYERGRAVSRNTSTALEWYEKAAAQDYENAKQAVERLAGSAQGPGAELVLRRYENPLSRIDADSWNAVTQSDATLIRGDLAKRYSEPELLANSEVRFSEHSLTAYEDVRFLELTLIKDQAEFFGYLLWGPNDFVPLNGDSPPLHALNATKKIDVYTRDSAAEYVYMFVNTLIAEEGRFLLVDEIDDLPFSDTLDASRRAVLEKGLIPLTFVGPPEWDEEAGRIEAFKFDATTLYGKHVFTVQLRVRPTGMVEMSNDEPLIGNLPIRSDNQVETITLKQD